jgi:sulfite reductase (NADPH) flavoprotein alpha-component
MVGPGTGLAPFRAMLQERTTLKATGENTLFFGCRHSTRDFLYKEELELLSAENKVNLYTAFSRDQKEKVYVQQRVKEAAPHVWKILESGGHVYICGDAQYMAGDVHTALTDVVTEYGKVSKEDAVKYLEELENLKRYQRDVWY